MQVQYKPLSFLLDIADRIANIVFRIKTWKTKKRVTRKSQQVFFSSSERKHAEHQFRLARAHAGLVVTRRVL